MTVKRNEARSVEVKSDSQLVVNYGNFETKDKMKAAYLIEVTKLSQYSSKFEIS